MKTLITTVFLLFFILKLQSQIVQDNISWMQYLESLTLNEEADDESISNLFDELSHLAEHPFNLYSATKNDLERLPFLSDIQIENLLYYIYKYKPLSDIYELKNVEDLDNQTIQYLLPFVYIGKVETDNSFISKGKIEHPKQEFIAGLNRTIQQKAGYKKENQDKTNKYYLGNPYSLNFRYNINTGDRILFGLSGEKDQGEPFFNKQNKRGFDFYSYNLLIKQLGIIQELHFGNYRLAFGQGLVLNNNFSLGKTADAISINRNSQGIKRHVSTNENEYFSGIAGNLKWKNFQIYLFYSNRNVDANADKEEIYSFKTDGYHRTYNDLLKKNSATIQTFGKHISWKKDNFSLGITSVYYDFNGKKLNPELRNYNRFYLRGKNHFNTGFSYQYKTRKFNFSGETAIDKSKKIASLNNFHFRPNSFLDWMVSLRYYDKAYNAFYGKGFSETTAIQNEKGVYSGLKIRLSKQFELSGNWDYFIFPWLKHGIDAPSSGNDISVQLKYYSLPKIQMTLRYRYKKKEKNILLENFKSAWILPYEQHRIRYQLYYNLSRNLGLRTLFDFNCYKEEIASSNGWSLSQSCFFIPKSSRFRLDGSIAYFHVDNWNNRISSYEKNILYTSGFSSYYGKGLRYYITMKWQIKKSIIFYLKVASTHYFTGEIISSGLEEILSKEKSDVYFLVKYSF